MPEQLFLQFLVVLDDTVVHTDYDRFDGAGSGTCAVSGNMGMRIGLGRITVGSPASVTDTTGAEQSASAVNLLRQVLKFAGSLYYFCQLIAVSYCDSCRIISSVFKLAQSLQKDRRSLMMTGKTNNSTHKSFSCIYV